MATTTKTLTPTNQTITLPDMTERPNASVLVDGIGKDADAINALNRSKANFLSLGTILISSNKTFSIANNTRAVIYMMGVSSNVQSEHIVSSSSTGAVIVSTVKAGSSITVTVPSTGKINISNSNESANAPVFALVFSGSIEMDT